MRQRVEFPLRRSTNPRKGGMTVLFLYDLSYKVSPSVNSNSSPVKNQQIIYTPINLRFCWGLAISYDLEYDVAFPVRNVQTFWRELLLLSPDLHCPILKIKAAVSSTTQHGGTTQKKTICNCFKSHMFFFPSVFILLKIRTCTYRSTSILCGMKRMMKIFITIPSMGIDKRLFECMNE